MDAIKRLESAVTQTRPIIAGASREQYGGPTPCTEWNVSELINHVLGALAMFRDIAVHGQVDPASLGRDHIGTDAVTAYDELAAETLGAWSRPGRLDEPALMPWGPMPADIALGMLANDLIVHGWDLARATGQQVVWDDVLIEEDYAFASLMFASPETRADSFAPAVPVGERAPAIDRLVGLLGRDPA